MNEYIHNDDVGFLGLKSLDNSNIHNRITSMKSSFDASNARQQGHECHESHESHASHECHESHKSHESHESHESHTSNASTVDPVLTRYDEHADREAWDFKAPRLSPCWYASSVTNASSRWSMTKTNTDDGNETVQQLLSCAVNWQPRVRFAITEDVPDDEQKKDNSDDDDRSLHHLISSSDDSHSPVHHMYTSYTFNGTDDDDASTSTRSLQNTARNSLDVDALILPAKLRNMYI
jgi:hypothetical protein